MTTPHPRQRRDSSGKTIGSSPLWTSSRAIAGVLGMQDDDLSDPDVISDFVARIADSVACPVTANL
jgi:2-methylisocitrate lyase-like PEP mutase family enzyme